MIRPEPGSVTIREVKLRICAFCGSSVTETGLCSHECPFDGEPRTHRDYFYAVYERTEKFLRDEPAK